MKSLSRWFRLTCRLTSLGILFAEPLYTAGGIHKFLFTGKEWVAGRTNFYMDITLVGGAGHESVAAGTLHPDFAVMGMNLLLGHSLRPFLLNTEHLF
jgi:hypothetical protein